MKSHRVMVQERNALHQIRRDDRITMVLMGLQSINDGLRLSNRHTIPYDTAAEMDGLRNARYRQHTQSQVVSAVITRLSLVTVVIVRNLTYTLTVQVLLTAPFEILILAHHRRCIVTIDGLVAGQNQSIDVITSRCLIVRYMFVQTRSRDDISLRLAVLKIIPIVRIQRIENPRLQIDLRWIFDNSDSVSRVTRVLIRIFTGIRIYLPIETERLLIAQTEQRVHIHHLLHRQIQTVVFQITVRTMTGEQILAGLTFSHPMPGKRRIRTDNNSRVNRIYLIGRQIKSVQRVATEAVRFSRSIICARI